MAAWLPASAPLPSRQVRVLPCTTAACLPVHIFQPIPTVPLCLPSSPQGTNAHAVLEVLDLAHPLPVFQTGDHPLPAWQRAAFWLLPPASLLLGRFGGRGAAGAATMQCQLQSPAAAALVRSAGSSGAWAVAAEAAFAAATMLLAAGDPKQQSQLGLAAATVSPAAGEALATAALLAVAADTRAGTLAVLAGNSQLLTAGIVSAREQPPSRSSAVPPSHHTALLPPVALQSDTQQHVPAMDDAAAVEAQHAQHAQGIFLQPALLQSGAQLQQATADDEPADPAAFDCLLPGCASPGIRSSGRSRGSTWRASASQRSMQLCSSKCSRVSVTGMQWRQRQRSALAAAPSSVDSRCTYAACWQAVQPAPAYRADGRHRRAAAVLTMGSQQQTTAARTGGSNGASDASQSACFRAMQLLQTAAARGATRVSLTAADTATTPAPPGVSSAALISSSALLAMLRCAANELPTVAVTAGSVDEAAPTSRTLPSWDAQYGCYGQQHSAGALVAARLLPTAEQPQQPAQQPAGAAGQLWAVSGGTGALGLLMAGWLQRQQAAGVLL